MGSPNLRNNLFTALVKAPVLAALSAIGLYEVWALVFQQKPLTVYARENIKRFPRSATLISFGLGVLMHHFFWSDEEKP